MKRYLSALVLGLLLWHPAAAQENAAPIAEDSEETETNAFGYPDKSLVTVIENNIIDKNITVNPKPACNDPRLIQQARETLRPYINANVQSIADRRKTKLILKNIDNFTPLNIQDVKADHNRSVAARLVELKINNHLSNQNIQICQSDNPVLSAKVYLVIYDAGDLIKTDIVNFSDKTIPGFVFKQN